MSERAVMSNSGASASSPVVVGGTQPRLTVTEVTNLIRSYVPGAPRTWGILLSKTASEAQQKEALANLLFMFLNSVQNTRAQLPILLAWTLNRGLPQEDLQRFMEQITKIATVKKVDHAAWHQKQLSVRAINSHWGDDWHLQLGSEVWDTLGHGASNPYTLLTAVLEGLAGASKDHGMDIIEDVIRAACARLQDAYKIKVGPQDIQTAITGRTKTATTDPVKPTPTKSAALCAPAIRSASTTRPNKPSLVRPGLPKPVLVRRGLPKPGLTRPSLPKPVLAKPVLAKPSLVKPTTTIVTKVSTAGDKYTAEPAATRAGKPHPATTATRHGYNQAGAPKRRTPAATATAIINDPIASAFQSGDRHVDDVNIDEAEKLIAEMVRAVDRAHAHLKPVMGRLAEGWDSGIPLDAVFDRVGGKVNDLRAAVRGKRLKDGTMKDGTVREGTRKDETRRDAGRVGKDGPVDGAEDRPWKKRKCW